MGEWAASGDDLRGPGAVVTFDEPLAVRRPAHEAVDLETERRRRRTVLFLSRVIVASVLGVAAALLDDSGVAVGLGLGFLYVPLVALAVSGRRPEHPARTALTLLADLGALLAFGSVAGAGNDVALAGMVLVALHTWSGGRAVGLAMVVLAAGADVASEVASGDSVRVGTMATTTAMGSLLAFLVDDQSRQGSRAASGLRLVSHKAEAILAGIGDAVLTTSADGRIRSANRAAEAVLGRRLDELVDQRCGSLVGLREGARMLGCEGRCQLLEVHGEATVEVHRTGPNGQRQPLLASATPLIDADGTVVEVIHSFRDITSVKQADEAKTLFLATASHELKTPLTVIRGFAQMLRAATLDADQRDEASTAIEARATQLSSIVDRLLMTSRIEAGHVDLEPTLCRIDDVLAHRTRELEAATGRAVERHLPSDLPLAWADLDALTTVLDHLLENAVKYSPDGGPVVVAAEVGDDAIRIRCTDVGIGMTDEQQARCFERFWQAEGTDVRRFGGTGIGLYIVRSLVEAMDGRIDVDSTPGQGTTFTIALRRFPPSAEATASDDPAPASAGSSIVGEFMRQVGMPADEHPPRQP